MDSSSVSNYFVDVLLPIPLERLFTYSITVEESKFISEGMRLAVPFGKNKIYTGLAMQVHNAPPTAYTAKEIHGILDETPMVTTHQLKHWKWVAAYYMCTLGEVFRAAVPSALLLESETLVHKNNEVELPEELVLSDEEFLVLEALNYQSALKVSEVGPIIDRKSVMPVLNSLLKKKAILLKEELYEKYAAKEIRHLRLAPTFRAEAALEKLMTELTRAPKQSQALLSIFLLGKGKEKWVKAKDFEQEGGVSRGVVKALIEKGVFEEYFLKEDRVDHSEEKEENKEIVLNENQLTAFSAIQRTFLENKVCLLHGVTSSGKTEVYLKLIEEYLAKGKSVLYLLPEIALTTQLVERLAAHLGDKMSVFHSRYNLHERIEVWQNTLDASVKTQLIIGARSSIFLPFQNLGLIIVDEEHEQSFKQIDPAPRYHARDASVVLSHIHNADILLGSATPSLESYHNAKKGKYGLASILQRYGNVMLPEIELVDLSVHHKKRKMKGHFSERLLEEIDQTLQNNGQVILFQNRRGYAPIMECTTCGHVPQCPNCDVSLTYHQYKKQLRCHYCGHHIAMLKNCLACGQNTLDTKGFGTEQIQEELSVLFPKANVGRMDLDTTRGKHGHAKIIKAFQNHETHILVGTQMLTKGLDFRNVDLVGIMNADSLLNIPDFRAHERAFQLMVQVAGRAGRTFKRGKVLIQSYDPNHKILQQVSTNSYEEMYHEQIYQREQYKYPPIIRMVMVTLKHRDFNTLENAAWWMAKSLKNVYGKAVLGPEAPVVSRVRNLYIKNILVKIPKEAHLAQTKNGMKRIEKSFHAIPQYKGVRVIYNVDYF